MPVSPETLARLRSTGGKPTSVLIRRGADEIFAGDAKHFPRDWSDYIGQQQAKDQLRTHIASARSRKTRIDHILLASGIAGVGKTTLATLVAHKAGTGMASVSGPLTVDDARRILSGMNDHDILFWDEFHLAVQGNRTRADWMLPFLQGGVLLTKQGEEPMPDVAVVAATTEAGKLPTTILSRFLIRPMLTPYSDDEAARIVWHHAHGMGVNMHGNESAARRIAKAANNNPRMMKHILVAVRDLAHLGPVDLGQAFRWAGTSHDGLSVNAQHMLLALLDSPKRTASLETLQAKLNEPGTLREPEQTLIQKGLVILSGQGRRLTDEGATRAEELLREQP